MKKHVKKFNLFLLLSVMTFSPALAFANSHGPSYTRPYASFHIKKMAHSFPMPGLRAVRLTAMRSSSKRNFEFLDQVNRIFQAKTSLAERQNPETLAASITHSQPKFLVLRI